MLGRRAQQSANMIPTIMSVYAYALLGAIYILIPLAYRLCKRNVPMKLSSLQEIETFLDPPHSNIAEQLTARALANSRLKDAFKINSTFVNSNVDVHSAFTRQAFQYLSLISDSSCSPDMLYNSFLRASYRCAA